MPPSFTEKSNANCLPGELAPNPVLAGNAFFNARKLSK
jgi:hypothetical protein